MEIVEEKRKLSVDEIYQSVLKNKSPEEKIKLADGLFEYAKKVNPKAFLWPKPLKHREIY